MNVTYANVIGVHVSAVNLRDAVDTIGRWIDSDDRQYVCVTGVHGEVECQRDPVLLDIHNSAGMVTPDGMPLVWLLWASGFRSADRVYGPDLMLATLERSVTEGWSNYLFGSTEETLERLRTQLLRRFPEIHIVGTRSPPFRPVTLEEDAEIVRALNESGADIVWVGLSTPKQERWMAEHQPMLNAKVLIGVGAAFDFHAGMVRQAPRWIQRSGFEWLFRVAMEPRRLFKRYAVNNSLFILYLMAQAFGLKRYQ